MSRRNTDGALIGRRMSPSLSALYALLIFAQDSPCGDSLPSLRETSGNRLKLVYNYT